MCQLDTNRSFCGAFRETGFAKSATLQQKPEAGSQNLETDSCRRSRRGGTEAIHRIWAQHTPYPAHFCNAYFRNLAAVPLGVNNFGRLGVPQRAYRRLLL